uniref:Uncharacterized protein n=1 Tax=Megaselia scalaris TaxID=36166 RepID=T1GMV1_MEGSC
MINKTLENSLLEDTGAAMEIDTDVDKEESSAKDIDGVAKQGNGQEKVCTVLIKQMGLNGITVTAQWKGLEIRRIKFPTLKILLIKDDGTLQQAQGQYKQVDKENGAVVQQGSFRYVADDGQTYETKWTADELGYHPEAAHLPVAPVA